MDARARGYLFRQRHDFVARDLLVTDADTLGKRY